MRLKSFDVGEMILETGLLWHVSQHHQMGCHSKSPLDSELSHVGSTRRDVLPTRANWVTKRLAYDPDPFFRGII